MALILLQPLAMREHVEQLKALFDPSSIAVVGASAHPGKVGYNVLYNLVENKRMGVLKAEIYPVNPKAECLLGLPCYPRLRDVPGPADLVVIVVPAKLVPDVMRDAARVDARAAIIISSGFSEVGNHALEEQVARIGRDAGIRILGPNCVGVYDPYTGVDTVFLPRTKVLETGEEVESSPKPPKGSISMITQSGAFGVSALDYMAGHNMGVSKFVSLGNKCDVDETDMLELMAVDERTKVVLLYIEDVKDGRRFMEVAGATTCDKPVVVLKAGWSSAGARAVKSHTGALAGSDAIYDAAFRQAGVLRARTMAEFFSMGKALALQPPAEGPNVAIITDAGGPGIMTVDACEARGLVVPEFSEATKAKLKRLAQEGRIPPFAAISNPVDLTVSVTADMYVEAVRVALEDPDIHGVIVLALHHPPALSAGFVDKLAELARGARKPVVACDIGEARMAELVRRRLDELGVPAFETPEDAAAAMAALAAYGRVLKRAGKSTGDREGGSGSPAPKT